MVGVPGRSKGCKTCRRRKKGVRTLFNSSKYTDFPVKIIMLTNYEFSVISNAQFAANV